MSRFNVRKVAVLGAGVMGAQIAAHLVNVKVPDILIDLPAKEGPKKGIAQLATATAREYLGTYTGRLLITANQQTPKIRQLASEKGITLLTARRFGEHKIEPGDQRQLIAEIRKLLGATHDGGMKPT